MYLLCLLVLALLPEPTRQGDGGVTSLTVEEALAQGVPLTFSPPTALSTLHAAHAASLAPQPPQPPGSLRPHLPALRQVAQLCASAADLGARDSGPLFALLLGLAEGQARVQAQHAQLVQAAVGAQGAPAPAPAPAPPPRAFLHSARWAGSGSGSGVGAAPASLLLPLGRALGVDVSVGAPGEGQPWELPRAVDFLVLDGARSHGAVLRDLLALAPRAQKFIGLPHSELAPPDAGSSGGAAAHAPGMALKAAVFDFLYPGNNSAQWEVQAHFSNDAGFTLLGRKRS